PPGPGAPPPPWPPASPTPAARAGSVRWWWALGALGLLLLAAGGVVGWWYTRDTGPSHPDQWDARVVDLVDFVSDERGLAWRHPVHVDFLTEEEFEGEVTADVAELTDDQRRDLDHAAGWY